MTGPIMRFAIALVVFEATCVCLSDQNRGHWGPWSSCSTTCGDGVRWRERKCVVSDKTCDKTIKESKHCFLKFCPSYLSWPRLHFSGKLTADVNTVNNIRCSYQNEKFSAAKLSKHFVGLEQNRGTHTYYKFVTGNWNPDGSNQIYFVDTYVTSFCNSPGKCSTSDPMVGLKVIESTRGVMAVLDPDWQLATEIFGLRVKIPGILEGDFGVASHQIEGTRLDHVVDKTVGYSISTMSRYKSKLYNVTWYDTYYKELFSNARELSISFVYDLFNQVSLSGRISGTIGLTSADDARQAMTTRVLQMLGTVLLHDRGSAPFYIHRSQRTLTLDLSYSVGGRQNGSLLASDLGKLDLVLLMTKRKYCKREKNSWDDSRNASSDSTECSPDAKPIHSTGNPVSKYFPRHRFCRVKGNTDSITWRSITKNGEISKRIGSDNTWYTNYGGVMDFDLTHLDAKTWQILEYTTMAILDRNNAVTYMTEFPHGVNIGLTEESIFRLNEGESKTIYGFVSSFGKPAKNARFNIYVMKNVLANAICDNCNRTLGVPEEALGISTDSHVSLTNSSGLVQIRLKSVKDPGDARGCGLDGQIYPLQLYVRYNKAGKSLTFSDYGITADGSGISSDYSANTLSIAAQLYQSVPEKECPTWNDVRHIFIQYYNLYPIMWKTGIIDLHSYHQIKRKSKMLKAAMFDTDWNDPRYMPISRDLSKGKKKLIWNWIKCGMKNVDSKTRAEKSNMCSDQYIKKGVKEVRTLLHKAVMLELSTIPPYVTAWLSLKTEYGRNVEIADVLKSVFNEEMLHMSLAGNILNAVGGVVNMTDESRLPMYPTILASGDAYEICPNVQVGLAPFSIGLVEDVFSNIEKPSEYDSRQFIHQLAQIWKMLPSRNEDKMISASTKKLIREYEALKFNASNTQSATSGVNLTTIENVTRTIKSELDHWKEIGNFANEKLKFVMERSSKTVGQFYSLIALKLTSLESCVQTMKIKSVLHERKKIDSYKTIFDGNLQHQLNISHWYQQSENSILHVVESMGGKTTGLDTTEIKNHVDSDSVRPELFEVTDLKSALEAIVEIVYQGEGGSECSPFVTNPSVYASEIGRDKGHEVSHYYRFQEIIHGRKLNKIPTPPERTELRCLNASRLDLCLSLANLNERYCYVGEKMTFYDDGVWPILTNPKEGHYRKGTKAYRLHEQFNLLYTRLLICLEETFGGKPTNIRNCMSTMYDMTMVGKRLMQTPLHVKEDTQKIEFGTTGKNGAPTWLFVREKPYRSGLPVRT